MLKPRKYLLGVVLNNLWIGLTLAAIWGTILVVIGAILFWYWVPPRWDLVFGSTKELAMWIAGMLVVAGIAILAVLDHFIAPHDPTDPLMTKGGLSRQQDIRR
jgi:hypothetical protein